MSAAKLPQRIVLASGNRGKLAEFSALFAAFDVSVVAQGDLGVQDAPETGLSFIENAILKARHAAAVTGIPALADDSGLCVDALDGAPGLYSARYAGQHGDDAANNRKLLAALQTVADPARGAFFISVLALVRHADDPAPVIAEGRWYGHVLHAPQGDNGFGYDPLFQPAGMHTSAAELTAAEKNTISHRAQALQKLKALLLP